MNSHQHDALDALDFELLEMLARLVPGHGHVLDYEKINPELLAALRDATVDILCNDLKVITEQELYPYETEGD